MLVDRGVEGVSRGCDAKALWKQLKKDGRLKVVTKRALAYAKPSVSGTLFWLEIL